MKFADLAIGNNFSFIRYHDEEEIVFQKIAEVSIKGLNGQTSTFNAIAIDQEGKQPYLDYVAQDAKVFPQPLSFWHDIYLEHSDRSQDEYITEILSDTAENAVKKYREETGDNAAEIFAVKREMM